MTQGMLLISLLIGCSARPTPPPSHVGYTQLQLPSSVHDFYEHESGLQSTMHQSRFSLPSRDLPSLKLPCVLGSIQTGPPAFAQVGTNSRDWYTPEKASRHQGCDFNVNGIPGSVLVDLGGPGDPVVYLVTSDGT